MSTYTPDRWVVLEISSPEHGKIRKVLASWYGGYGGSDSWKLSSGTMDVKEEGDNFVFTQSSGSLYVCNKNCYGMSNYTASVLNQLLAEVNILKDGTYVNVLEQTSFS